MNLTGCCLRNGTRKNLTDVGEYINSMKISLFKELYERKKEAVNNWRNIVEEIEESLLNKMSLFSV